MVHHYYTSPVQTISYTVQEYISITDVILVYVLPTNDINDHGRISRLPTRKDLEFIDGAAITTFGGKL